MRSARESRQILERVVNEGLKVERNLEEVQWDYTAGES